MMQFLIAAPRSGSGKTTVTCALLTALQRRGTDPCAFKCGPDYIDPMFHRSALGVESHNLDLYLSAPDTVRTLYARYAAGHGAAVCEGAMGFYDGQGLTTRGDVYQIESIYFGNWFSATGQQPLCLCQHDYAGQWRKAAGAFAVPHTQPYRGHSAQ